MDNENDPKAIREEIAATRERIADTAEALAYKSDVSARVKENVSARVEGFKAAVSDAASSMTTKLTGVSETTKSNVHDLADSAKSTLGDATETARAALSDATDAAKGHLTSGASAASDLAHRTRDNVTPSGERTLALAENARAVVVANPLGLALGSIAIGFLIGLVLPVSNLERDNVGPIGDRVAEQAKSTASDLAQQGKAAVAAAVSDTLTSASAPRS